MTHTARFTENRRLKWRMDQGKASAPEGNGICSVPSMWHVVQYHRAPGYTTSL